MAPKAKSTAAKNKPPSVMKAGGVVKRAWARKPQMMRFISDEERAQKQDPAKVDTFSQTVKGLRDALGLLDIAVPHSVLKNGKWKSMNPAQLRASYERRYAAITGNKIMREWAAAFPMGIPGAGTMGSAQLCWIVKRGHPASLPWTCREGSRSAAVHGRYERVNMWTYETVSDVPDGVTICDAGKLLDHSEMETYRDQGFIEPHLADYVRLLAAKWGGAQISDIIDGDTMHKPSAESADEYMYLEHWFATLGLNPSSTENRNFNRRSIQLALNYCMYPRDYAKFVFPARFPASSPLLEAILKDCEAYFKGGKPSEDYNVIMDICANNIVKLGMENGYAPIKAYSVIPFYVHDRSLEKGSDSQPDNMLV